MRDRQVQWSRRESALGSPGPSPVTPLPPDGQRWRVLFLFVCFWVSSYQWSWSTTSPHTLPSKFYNTVVTPGAAWHTQYWKSQPIWPPLKVGPYLNTILQSISISSSCPQPLSRVMHRPFLELCPGLIPTGLMSEGVRGRDWVSW